MKSKRDIQGGYGDCRESKLFASVFPTENIGQIPEPALIV